MICPPSTEFLANLSGCHAKIPIASPASILFNISAKTGRPGALAVCFSTKISITSMFCFIFVCHIFSSQNIKKIIALRSAKGGTKKDWLAKLCFAFGFAKTNFQIQNQNISFLPRGAWQILSKSALCACSAPNAARSAANKCPQNLNFINWRYCLDEIRTFFEQNPEDFAD